MELIPGYCCADHLFYYHTDTLPDGIEIPDVKQLSFTIHLGINYAASYADSDPLAFWDGSLAVTSPRSLEVVTIDVHARQWDNCLDWHSSRDAGVSFSSTLLGPPFAKLRRVRVNVACGAEDSNPAYTWAQISAVISEVFQPLQQRGLLEVRKIAPGNSIF